MSYFTGAMEKIVAFIWCQKLYFEWWIQKWYTFDTDYHGMESNISLGWIDRMLFTWKLSVISPHLRAMCWTRVCITMKDSMRRMCLNMVLIAGCSANVHVSSLRSHSYGDLRTRLTSNVIFISIFHKNRICVYFKL